MVILVLLVGHTSFLRDLCQLTTRKVVLKCSYDQTEDFYQARRTLSLRPDDDHYGSKTGRQNLPHGGSKEKARTRRAKDDLV